MPAKTSVESTTTVLTPAFSVNTTACGACSSSQSPNALAPVKSISLHLGSHGQVGGEPVVGVLGRQRHQVRVEARPRRAPRWRPAR